MPNRFYGLTHVINLAGSNGPWQLTDEGANFDLFRIDLKNRTL